MDSESTPQPAKGVRDEQPNFQKNILESAYQMPFLYRRSMLGLDGDYSSFDYKNNRPVPNNQQFPPNNNKEIS